MLGKPGLHVVSNLFLSCCSGMSRIASSEVFEAEELLEEVDSWCRSSIGRRQESSGV
jgi:hypothetical protein